MTEELNFFSGGGMITHVNLPSPLGFKMVPGKKTGLMKCCVKILHFQYGQGLIRPPFSEKIYKISLKGQKLSFDTEKLIRNK